MGVLPLAHGHLPALIFPSAWILSRKWRGVPETRTRPARRLPNPTPMNHTQDRGALRGPRWVWAGCAGFGSREAPSPDTPSHVSDVSGLNQASRGGDRGGVDETTPATPAAGARSLDISVGIRDARRPRPRHGTRRANQAQRAAHEFGPRESTSTLLPRYHRRRPEVNEAIAPTCRAGGHARRIRGALQPLLTAAPLFRVRSRGSSPRSRTGWRRRTRSLADIRRDLSLPRCAGRRRAGARVGALSISPPEVTHLLRRRRYRRGWKSRPSGDGVLGPGLSKSGMRAASRSAK
mgnify:CR=1 FL=1